MATAVGNVVVDTDNLRIASKVAVKAQKKDAVRGVIQVDGQRYRWSTLQQYQFHGGFTAKKGGHR
ncbi:MAG: hypothetical protein GYB21_01005 [Oceanospirillales bacterium]|nr:hypothetical protein [Oceanospirillales bacterium]